MALNLKSTVTEASDCTSFVLIDTTGTYDVSTTPGGWGTPNPATTDVTAVYVDVTLMGYSAEATTLDITASFADLFTSSGLTITSTELFSAGTFVDGYYQIVYRVVTASASYTYYNYTSFLCSVKCCVRKDAVNIKTPVGNFQEVEETHLKFMLLQASAWASCCGNADNAATLIEYLKLLCAGCGESQVNTFKSITSSSNTGCCS